MIEFRNVCKAYDKKVINDLSFKINQGESLGIFGESGIGKSTIINLILGLEKADQGEIITSFSKSAVVFQENRLIDEISAIENLLMITDDKNKAIRSLNLFNISDYDKKLSEFSGGMKRRVALARAYLYDGDILVMDEPFTGIDEENKDKAIEVLLDRYKSIVLVSHNKDDFRKFGIHNLIYL